MNIGTVTLMLVLLLFCSSGADAGQSNLEFTNGYTPVEVPSHRLSKADMRLYDPGEDVEQMIYEVFGPELAPTALAVSYAENQRRDCRIAVREPDGSVSYGIFQMNSKHITNYPQYNFRDCRENILAAHEHYRRHGWSRWTQYRNGIYRRFLPMFHGFVPAAGDTFDQVNNRLIFTSP